MFSRVVKLTLVAALTCAALSLVLSTASASEVSNTDSQLTLETPTGWQLDRGDVMVLTSPDDTTYIYFWALDEDALDGAAKNIKGAVGSILSKVKAKGKAKKAEANGVKSARLSGTGTIQGIAVVWTAVVVKGGDRPAMLLGFADKESWKANAEAFDGIVATVKPVKP